MHIASAACPILGIAFLTISASSAHAQCVVTLNEVNYDCALEAQSGETCEFIELKFSNFTPGTHVHECGVTSIELINGATCETYASIDLVTPNMEIPTNGLFVVAKTAAENVDLVPASWTNLQNGSPDWIWLGPDARNGSRYFVYETDAVTYTDCSADAGYTPIGADLDFGSQTPGGVLVREESVQLCDDAWVGDVYTAVNDIIFSQSGPVQTPGLVNDCTTILLHDNTDAGVGADTTLDDATTGPDATAHDALAADSSVTDSTVYTDGGVIDGFNSDVTAPDTHTPVDASVNDLTQADSSTSGCGQITLFGACDGTVVQYCDEESNTLADYDCADDDLECGLVDCDDEELCWGYDCVAPVGESCGLGQYDNFCNGGLEHGCIDGVCAPSSTCAVDTYADSCTTTSNMTFCFTALDGTTGQVWTYDCSENGSLPYVCGEHSEGYIDCLGTEGGMCDAQEGYECAPGLVCNSNGYCMIATGDDAGVTDDAAGRDGATQDAVVAADVVMHDTNTTSDASAQDLDNLVDTRVADTAVRPDTRISGVDSSQTDGGSNVDETGCSCATQATRAPLVLLALLGLLLIGRRRL